MSTKHINLCHHFLRDVVDDRDIDIKYINSEENPAGIMTKNFPKAEHGKHTNSIIEVELSELLETVSENVNNDGVDRVTYCESTKYLL